MQGEDDFERFNSLGLLSGNRRVDEEVENNLVATLVNLGRATNDVGTMLNAAKSIAHMTEVLHCNPQVASTQTMEFMMTMLKDTKNVRNHREGCRYFANLSYYKQYINNLIDMKITAYMLGTIEQDNQNASNDEDAIKYSVIALANLSSHPNFMTETQKAAKGDITQLSRVDRGKIKPLIHILDSAQQSNINIIQSACITLCNMATKTSLHQHFVEEPELSTLKNCFQSCIGHKNKPGYTNLLRFMIKLVCNLTKNPSIVPCLSKRGFLDVLIDLLQEEK
jgi:ABC-type transporter Mla MlaB component